MTCRIKLGVAGPPAGARAMADYLAQEALKSERKAIACYYAAESRAACDPRFATVCAALGAPALGPEPQKAHGSTKGASGGPVIGGLNAFKATIIREIIEKG